MAANRSLRRPAPVGMGACLALLVASSLGCASAGSRLDADSIGKIEPGVTTEVELRRWFGEPSSVSVRASGGRRWRYYHEERRERSTATLSRIGTFVAALFGRWVPVSPVNVTYSNTIRHDLVVVFHPDGVVEDYSYERSETPRRSIR